MVHRKKSFTQEGGGTVLWTKGKLEQWERKQRREKIPPQNPGHKCKKKIKKPQQNNKASAQTIRKELVSAKKNTVGTKAENQKEDPNP